MMSQASSFFFSLFFGGSIKTQISFVMTSFPPSWCLMRLAMVQLVLVNLKSFYPMAGYDLLGKH